MTCNGYERRGSECVCSKSGVACIEQVPRCTTTGEATLPPSPTSASSHSNSSNWTDVASAPYFLVPGDASGPLLWADSPLSLWSDVDAASGSVRAGTSRPLAGFALRGKVLAIPHGGQSEPGDSMGVAAGLLECIAAGEGPAALILAQADAVVALGAVVAKALFGTTLPVLVVGQRRYDQMASGGAVHISAAVNRFKIANPSTQSMIARIRPTPAPGLVLAPPTGGEGSADPPEIELSESDRATLAGEQGEAAKQALEIVVAMARITGATRLLGVRSARLHAPRFVGPAGLKFAQHFAGLGGKFAVPTTMGASSEASAALGEVYTSMGATSDDTSVPAELPGQKVGDDLPASDYPELLDVAIALTARAPDVPLQSWPRKQQEQEKEALAPTLPSALADGACCEDKVCVCSATATIQAVDITV